MNDFFTLFLPGAVSLKFCISILPIFSNTHYYTLMYNPIAYQTSYVMKASVYIKNPSILAKNNLVKLAELEEALLSNKAVCFQRRRTKLTDSLSESIELANTYKKHDVNLANRGDGPLIKVQTISEVSQEQRPNITVNGSKQNYYPTVSTYLNTYRLLYKYIIDDLDAAWVKKYGESKTNAIKKILPITSLSPVVTIIGDNKINKPLFCRFKNVNNVIRYAKCIDSFLEDFEWVDDVTQYEELTTRQFKEMQALDKLSKLIIYINGNIEVHKLQATIGILHEYNRVLNVLSNRITDLEVKNVLHIYKNNSGLVLRRLRRVLSDSSEKTLLNSSGKVLKLQYSIDLDDHVKDITFKYE